MNSQKEKFSLDEGIHYLNCAFRSPLLKSAEEAGIKALETARNPYKLQADDFFDETQLVREEFAKLINAEAHYTALMPSTSYGFGTVLKNVKAKKGGTALTLKDEFPSGYYSLRNWCRENDNELIIVKPGEREAPGESWNRNILEEITDRTSVVLMSSVHWMNGIRFDLEAIGNRCEEVGAVFIVDGTQTVGAMQFDVKKFKIDALVCACYKWLLGPYSTTLAYLNEKFSNGTPLEDVWMNKVNARQFHALTNYTDDYQPYSARYNMGESSNFILTPMILASLRQLNSWKPENIQAYGRDLSTPLFDYLRESGVEFEDEKYRVNHMFGLPLPANTNVELLKENLAANKVYISLRGEFIRVSVNVFNDEEDVARLIDAIQRTVGN